jgi:hydroxymethylpyrimidine pyrophosphatase-like HAD family hydrolase
MRQRIIYVDVDDTLVRSFGTKRIPMPPVIAYVRKLKADGVTLYLWSSGGADYCRATAIDLGIEDCFSGFLPKPDIYIDDQSFDAWRDCRHVHPSQVDNT